MAAASGRMQRSQAEVEVPRKSDPRGGEKSAATPMPAERCLPSINRREMSWLEPADDMYQPSIRLECSTFTSHVSTRGRSSQCWK
ncbi:hypothetical protein BgiBS90_015293 [Biomphalaria glabrata]|nr:hypothetical protein BgiBS90_015293 [Biomphalaria glabrata]